MKKVLLAGIATMSLLSLSAATWRTSVYSGDFTNTANWVNGIYPSDTTQNAVFSGGKDQGDYSVRLMDGDFTVESSVPDRGVTTLLQQGDRKIVHLLYAHTTKRGADTEVIEDIVPLYNVDVKVKCAKPESVTLVPQNEKIDFTYTDGRVTFTVPKVEIHQMICIE